MKDRMFLIIILIISTTSFVNSIENDNFNLTKQSNFTEEGDELEYTFIYQYDGDILIRWEQYSGSDLLLKAYNLEYNSENQVVRKLNYNGEFLKSFITYDYNQAGQNVKQSTYYDISGLEALGIEEESVLSSYVTFNYDSDGNLEKQSRYDQYHNPQGYVCYDYISVDSEDNENGFKIQTKHYYDENGNLTQQIGYEYDNSGQIIMLSEILYSWGISGETIFEYDNDGNLIKELYYYNGSLESYKEYEYNRNNWETSYIEYYTFGEGEIDILLQINYTYDSFGNKTEKRVFDNEGNSKGFILYEYTEGNL